MAFAGCSYSGPPELLFPPPCPSIDVVATRDTPCLCLLWLGRKHKKYRKQNYAPGGFGPANQQASRVTLTQCWVLPTTRCANSSRWRRRSTPPNCFVGLCFSLLFIDFHCVSLLLHLLYNTFHCFSLLFIAFHLFLGQLGGGARPQKCFLRCLLFMTFSGTKSFRLGLHANPFRPP